MTAGARDAVLLAVTLIDFGQIAADRLAHVDRQRALDQPPRESRRRPV
jgi:hypothetical protein